MSKERREKVNSGLSTVLCHRRDNDIIIEKGQKQKLVDIEEGSASDIVAATPWENTTHVNREQWQ